MTCPTSPDRDPHHRGRPADVDPLALLALRTAGPYVGRENRIESRADRLLPLADNVTLPVAADRFEILVIGAARQPRRYLRLSADFTVPGAAVDVLPDRVRRGRISQGEVSCHSRLWIRRPKWRPRGRRHGDLRPSSQPHEGSRPRGSR